MQQKLYNRKQSSEMYAFTIHLIIMQKSYPMQPIQSTHSTPHSTLKQALPLPSLPEVYPESQYSTISVHSPHTHISPTHIQLNRIHPPNRALFLLKPAQIQIPMQHRPDPPIAILTPYHIHPPGNCIPPFVPPVAINTPLLVYSPITLSAVVYAM